MSESGGFWGSDSADVGLQECEDINERESININHIAHKIGVHNLVYWKPDGEWLRSSKSVESIELAYAAREKRICDKE